jgi:hypothetical protein
MGLKNQKKQGSCDGLFLYENIDLGKASLYHAIGRGVLSVWN